MNSDPIMTKVNSARQAAISKKYEESLRYYNEAKEIILEEIDSCKNPEEIRKWNKINDDLAIEIAAITKLKASIAKGAAELNQPSDKMNFSVLLDDDDSFGQPEREQNQMAIKPVKVSNVQRKRPVVSAGRAISRQAPSQISKKPQTPAHLPSKIQSKPPVNSNANNPKKAKANQPAPEKPPLDPETNPLVQQIIDMGILIKEPNVTWDSIAGLRDVKRLLRQNLVILPLRPDICKGLLSPWKSVLFYGPPGTGKTYLAKAVATECKRTFFNITSASITSRYLGESEKLVSYLFTLANQMAPATIFFDEIDSIASQRGGSNEGEAARRMKAQLLTALEGIDGASDDSKIFVLAATNFPWDLDEALLRRFQKRIYIPLPDIEAREAILNMTIKENVDEEFDMHGWAQKLEGYSCADISNLCRDAVQAKFSKLMADLDSTQAFLNMDASQISVVLKNEDFAEAVKHRKSSVNPETLQRYEEWRKARGAD